MVGPLAVTTTANERIIEEYYYHFGSFINNSPDLFFECKRYSLAYHCFYSLFTSLEVGKFDLGGSNTWHQPPWTGDSSAYS